VLLDWRMQVSSLCFRRMKKSGRLNVSIVFTGGTISMRFDPAVGGAVPILSGEEILAQVPGLKEIANVEVNNFSRLPGPHMTPAKMMELARTVQELCHQPSVDAVVLTHGTDTLEETAYLLDLVLQEEKPVVFVGAMRNSSELGWDGPANLLSAVRVACAPDARNQGVLVVMNETVICASEVIKTHTESVNTFQSRNFGPIGLLDKGTVLFDRQRLHREHIPAAKLEENVETIKLSAGSSGRFIRCAVDEGARGLVLEGMGRGNVPITAVSEVERVLRSGIPVVITSRCPYGKVLDTYAYEGGGHHLTEMGAILGGMLPSHKARIKMMLLLGAGRNLEEITRSFEGEII
jgi:L-asparaginase